MCASPASMSCESGRMCRQSGPVEPAVQGWGAEQASTSVRDTAAPSMKQTRSRSTVKPAPEP
jgi:hypothetical protein